MLRPLYKALSHRGVAVVDVQLVGVDQPAGDRGTHGPDADKTH